MNMLDIRPELIEEFDSEFEFFSLYVNLLKVNPKLALEFIDNSHNNIEKFYGTDNRAEYFKLNTYSHRLDMFPDKVSEVISLIDSKLDNGVTHNSDYAIIFNVLVQYLKGNIERPKRYNDYILSLKESKTRFYFQLLVKFIELDKVKPDENYLKIMIGSYYDLYEVESRRGKLIFYKYLVELRNHNRYVYELINSIVNKSISV